jgi:hypothetical protein
MYTPKPLIQGSVLTAGYVGYYTAPAGTSTRITQFSLTNTDVVPRSVSIYLAPSPTVTPALADTAIVTKTLSANETWVPYQVLDAVLNPSGTIVLIASAAGVVVAKSSGVEIS